MHGGTHHDWDDVLDERTPAHRRICIDLDSSSAADSPWAAAGGHVYSDAPGAEDNAHRLPQPTGGSGPEQGRAPSTNSAPSGAQSADVRRSLRIRRSLKAKLAAWASRDRPWMFHFRIGLGICAICWSAATLTTVLLSAELVKEATLLAMLFYAFALVVLITAIAFVVTLVTAVTAHFGLVAAFMFFTWLNAWSLLCLQGISLGGWSTALWPLIEVVYGGSFATCIVLKFALVHLWIQAMQVCSQGETQKRNRLALCMWWLVTSVLVFFGLYLWRRHGGRGLLLPILLSLGSAVCAAVSFALTSLAYLFWVWQIATAVLLVAKGRVRDEALDAKKTAQFQFIGVLWCYLMMLINCLLSLSVGVLRRVSLYEVLLLAGVVRIVGNVVVGLSLAGVFTGSFVGEIIRTRVEYQQACLRGTSRKAWRRSSCVAWHESLEMLADRAFTLDSLLHFYKGLGKEYMHHFDSGRHSTADVTWEAIIPLSSERGDAYATIMMDGKPTRPDKMVTHWWGGMFRSLVAAIVADALGESEFALIAYLLDHDVERLEAWIAGMGKGTATYWVCCFSVNQHLSICGSPPPDQLDPVTGLVHKACSCSRAKVWNQTPPCFEDKSIGCEMNKFDEMLAFMGVTSSLEQVVAVDEGFRLFTRAWCVAELAVAAEMGIPQRLKVHSRAMLDENLAWLSDMCVEDMEASRPEDKEEILSKIYDTKEFDRKLRALLTERLFPDWRTLNRVDQMRRVGRLARWHAVSQTPRLSGIWQATVAAR